MSTRPQADDRYVGEIQMATTPENGDLKSLIEDFSRACRRWQRAASARSVLLQIQDGEVPPPLMELSSKVEGGEPVRVAIDLTRLASGEVAGLLGPTIEFLYREYKQSLMDAGVAALAAHKLLEANEWSETPSSGAGLYSANSPSHDPAV
jgi:hypothetical protein